MTDALDLYQEAIVAAARRAGEHPRLDHPSGTATIDNPLCGDRVTTDVVTREAMLDRMGHRVRGCLLCEASATLLAELATECDSRDLAGLREAVEALLGGAGWGHRDPRFEPFAIFAPVAGVPSRHRCVMLPFESVDAAMRAALDGDSGSRDGAGV